jgi:hypothetical protein
MKNKLGRKPHGETAKVHKSIKFEQYLIDFILDEYESFSGGLEKLAKKALKNKLRKKR